MLAGRRAYRDVIAARLSDPLHSSLRLRRQHDLVVDKYVLVDDPIDVATSDVAPNLSEYNRILMWYFTLLCL